MTHEGSPALHTLLEGIIDYAGTFPPATLSADAAIDNYRRYRSSEHAWMLRWLVVAAADLPRVPTDLDGCLAVLSNDDEPRAAVIEAKRAAGFSRPVYCEVPIDQLEEVKRQGGFAKLRTGGITPEAIPTIEAVARFIAACAERRLPFKATAGLHHPVRARQSLTYAPDPPRAVLHGFVNVFVAAAFAWHHRPDLLEPLLAETDPTAFRFDDCVHWRNERLTIEQVRRARRDFAHAFGSCSFEEPIHDLQTLGWL